jgi:hypothetical protein
VVVRVVTRAGYAQPPVGRRGQGVTICALDHGCGYDCDEWRHGKKATPLRHLSSRVRGWRGSVRNPAAAAARAERNHRRRATPSVTTARVTTAAGATGERRSSWPARCPRQAGFSKAAFEAAPVTAARSRLYPIRMGNKLCYARHLDLSRQEGDGEGELSAQARRGKEMN